MSCVDSARQELALEARPGDVAAEDGDLPPLAPRHRADDFRARDRAVELADEVRGPAGHAGRPVMRRSGSRHALGVGIAPGRRGRGGGRGGLVRPGAEVGGAQPVGAGEAAAPAARRPADPPKAKSANSA